MKYPAWVPLQIQELDWELFGDRCSLEVSEEVISSHEFPEFVRAVNKFASDPNFEKISQTLTRHGSEHEPSEPLWELFGLVRHLLTTPTSYADKAPQHVRDRKLSQLQAASKKLSGLVEETRIEAFLPHLAVQHFVVSKDNRGMEIGSTKVDLVEILNHLIEQAEEAKGVQGLLPTAHVNDKSREITYFIHHLHEYFFSTFGKYLDDSVAILVEIFFDRKVGREFVRAKRQNAKVEKTESDERRLMWDV